MPLDVILGGEKPHTQKTCAAGQRRNNKKVSWRHCQIDGNTLKLRSTKSLRGESPEMARVMKLGMVRVIRRCLQWATCS
jgi:hypothetical protein